MVCDRILTISSPSTKWSGTNLPTNTTATVTLPADKLDRLTESGKPVAQTATIGSGKYRFVSE